MCRFRTQSLYVSPACLTHNRFVMLCHACQSATVATLYQCHMPQDIPVLLRHALDEAHGSPSRAKNDNTWLLHTLGNFRVHVFRHTGCWNNIVALCLSPVALKQQQMRTSPCRPRQHQSKMFTRSSRSQIPREKALLC